MSVLTLAVLTVIITYVVSLMVLSMALLKNTDPFCKCYEVASVGESRHAFVSDRSRKLELVIPNAWYGVQC